MRTRCPACSTVFRATSEQLRLKAGKVRCGHCQAVFNAFEHLLEVAPEAEPLLPSAPAVPDVASEYPDAVLREPETVPLDPETCTADVESAPTQETQLHVEAIEPPADQADLVENPAPRQSEIATVSRADALAIQDETPEETTQAARAAGLVAARELRDTQSYNRWAAGTLADGSLGSFAQHSSKRALWPFVIVSLLLLLALAVQLSLYYRTELVRRVPSLGALYALASVEIPLSRDADLVAIETSDLQSDSARGLFVLQATLRNRAPYPQDWPALELAFTDTHDAIVARRVLNADEYLPLGMDPKAFPANSEVAVKLWIEAKEIGAAGYRLYIFYP